MKRLVLALVIVLVGIALGRSAAAHDFRPGVLGLTEVAPGRYELRWIPPLDSRGAAAEIEPVFPPQCVREGTRLDCGAAGLSGTIRFEPPPPARVTIAVHVAHVDGSTREALLRGGEDEFTVAAPRAADRVVLDYAALGADHILGGFDHLAFVLALIVLIGFGTRLLIAITGFTLAHSATLAAASLGVANVPVGAVEAAIALSIVMVAREALREGPTLSRRAPWLPACLFGLLHGFGFAGALAELGFPRSSVVAALFGFNLGVELGQAAFVAAAWLLVRGLARRGDYPWTKHAIAYAIGCLGAYWTLARLMAMLGVTAP